MLPIFDPNMWLGWWQSLQELNPGLLDIIRALFMSPKPGGMPML